MAKKTTRTPIDSIRHDDRRANIPTEELRGFVAGDEAAPPSLLYPRDPSLDPQLVWKGKDEQDRDGLDVPVVPIYIQEKIHPQAIIEDFLREARRKEGEQGRGGESGIAEEPAAWQLNLFADFNGLEEDDFSRKLDFYSHDDGSRPYWSNRMILGDSLLVMNSLAEKEGLKGRVQMIYIDPPYGIKFGSNWQVSTRKRDVKDGSADHLTRQPEQVKAFRDTWQLGIHSYLSYLRDRLTVARELLTETGSVFVQIGDENVHLVRALMDEVFGNDNFCRTIIVSKTSGQTDKLIATTTDYLLWYAKDLELVKFRQLFWEKEGGESGSRPYQFVQLEDGQRRRMTPAEYKNLGILPVNSKVFRLSGTSSMTRGASLPDAFSFQGRMFLPEKSRGWSTTISGLDRLATAERIRISGSTIAYIRFLRDFPVYPVANYWHDTGTGSFTEDKIYVVQTGVKIIERCILMTTDPGDLVLDPTCGSGTTATVAEQWGRRWITIDTSRVALALARTRLMSARYPWYHLAADHPHLPPTASDEEIKAWLRQPPPAETGFFPKNPVSTVPIGIGKGFIYRRVPHITLKSIANNPEIDAIHDKWQPQLDALRTEINRAALETGFFPKNPVSKTVSKKPPWEEWEIPRVASDEQRPPSSDELTNAEAVEMLLARWWELRRERQAEIDDAIARHADSETLYDQPYEDNKRLRVAGPFTVESLSPHRTLETETRFLPGNRVSNLSAIETGFSGKNPVS
ncbi:MAG: site-specific DNA-methyltransferase, partial [Anaerolineae bacterium]|nr:site-specific DNA-methyltransferase [Anaerolineae bacterium]